MSKSRIDFKIEELRVEQEALRRVTRDTATAIEAINIRISDLEDVRYVREKKEVKKERELSDTQKYPVIEDLVNE